MTQPTEPASEQTSSASPQPSGQTLPSHEIQVGRFELSLLWPILIQARKNQFGEYDKADKALDPSDPKFLTNWVKQITDGQSAWEVLANGYPPRNRSEFAARAYSEFCYFHPFVRNFLYVTRDDIRAYVDRDPAEAAKLEPEDLIKKSLNRNMRILERPDVSDATLTVDYDMAPRDGADAVSMQSQFQVQSCWMYLFDTQIALVELQMNHKATTGEGNFSLRHVLHLQDIVRRLYAPYWSMYAPNGEVKHETGHVPKKMTLQLRDQLEVTAQFGNFSVAPNANEGETVQALRGKVQECDPGIAQRLKADPEAIEEFDIAKQQREHVYFHREPHTSAIWKKLLEPLVPLHLTIENYPRRLPQTPEKDFGLRFEHIQDDRVPLMSYVGIKETEEQKGQRERAEKGALESATLLNPVRRITTGDWMRLAFVDDEGNSSQYPYSPEFFHEDPLKGVAYDRFWHGTGLEPAQDGFQATRWLCSGYAFTAVGNADSPFFADEQAGALCHFRQHYFALSLIAHFHRASLLRYKHQLAEIADALVSDDEPSKDLRNYDFRQDIDALSEELMRFTTLYWFSEVSNQVQGMELFDMYRNHLSLQTLFDDVQRDTENAANLLRQWNSEKQADAAQRLAVLGAIFLVVAPVIGLFNERWEKKPFLAGCLLAVLLIMLMVPMMKVPISLKVRWRKVSRKLRPKVNSFVRWLAENSKTIFCSRATRLVAWGAITATCIFGLGYLGCQDVPERQVPPTEMGDKGPPEKPVRGVLPDSDGGQRALPSASGRSVQPDNQPSSDVNGSKSSESMAAPQNPDSGSIPPDQEAGAGGDAATSRPISKPAPKKPTSDAP